MRILVVRDDRIGDVVLTTPVFRAIRAQLSGAQVDLFTSPDGAEVARGHPDVSEVLVHDRKAGLAGLRREIASRRYDAAILASPSPRSAALLWWAGVRRRIGTGYRWYSFLMNERVYEHRSRGAERHEAEFTLRLLSPLGVRVPARLEPGIRTSPAERREAAAVLSEAGLRAGARAVAVHPGSGGSAPNWPPDRYAAVADLLARAGWAVAITGSVGERALAEAVATRMSRRPAVLAGRLGLRALSAAMARFELFVSSSTGPMHLAAAAGTRVLALFSTRRVLSARRWGPLTAARTILTGADPSCSACAAGDCARHEDLARVPVARAFEAATGLLRRTRPSRPGLPAAGSA